MRLRLGEGGVVAARAADQRPPGAAAPRREQVPVGPAVEEGRAGDAADQPVRAGAAVEAVGAEAGLDQVVLGPPFDRVVAEPPARRTKPTAASESAIRNRSLPGPRSAISQRAGPSMAQETCVGDPVGRVQPLPIAIPFAAEIAKVSVALS